MYNDSSNIFIAHNHPLGNSNPSKSDFVATDNIFRSLEKIDIHLIDHIIVGKDSVISMKELPFTMAFKAGYDSGYKVQDASEIKK
jgi:DNA repair protein RadC